MWSRPILLITLYFSCLVRECAKAACPKSTNYVRRLGQTRYYILHGPKREKFLTQAEAKIECKKHGLELATVRSMMSMTVLGRELEKLARKHKLRDTWYWLEAAYNEKSQTYLWGDPEDGNILQYGNFLYRPPRPIGVGGHTDYKGIYQRDLPLQQCLTLALPWPWTLRENSTYYGFQTSFDERYCESKKSRHAMCESLDEECLLKPTSPFQISESQVSYFEDGNWIFGDRKYIVNWKHRNMSDTETYCKSLELQVMFPGKYERVLIPYIKMWSRSITTTLFWTSLKYNATSMQFQDKDGKFIANMSLGVNFTEETDLEISARSAKSDDLFCVALSLSYEFKSQMPCPDNSSRACSWSFINYVPSNCNNYHAAICQHGDFNNRATNWTKFDKSNLTSVLTDNVLTDFGFVVSNKNNRAVIRSKVKQTFGLCYCPIGYRMLRYNETKPNVDWGSKPKNQKNLFKYDYLETYWVVDRQLFNKSEDSTCMITYVEPDEEYNRKFKNVSCTEWHFYLCQKILGKEKDRQKTRGNFQTTEPMQWRDGPQPRVYPIVEQSILVNITEPAQTNNTETTQVNNTQPSSSTEKPPPKKPARKAKEKKIKVFDNF